RRARLLAFAEGRGAGDHRYRALRVRVVAGPPRVLEIAADAGEGDAARLHRLDRVQQARDRIIERMIGRGGEQIEARSQKLIEHPGWRAEMRAATLQRRIAAVVVG